MAKTVMTSKEEEYNKNIYKDGSDDSITLDNDLEIKHKNEDWEYEHRNDKLMCVYCKKELKVFINRVFTCDECDSRCCNKYYPNCQYWPIF